MSRACLQVGAAALFLACKGPERSDRVAPLELPDQAPMVVQWGDGPRKDNAERAMEKEAQRQMAGLFRAEPMARELGSTPEPVAAEPVAAPDQATPSARPSWADGVDKPADAGANDLPQGWPVEIRRGETPALIAEWSGGDAKELIAQNAEVLGTRKWFKVGDRITVTLSANQKVAFDRKRDQYAKGRVNEFFSTRYFEKVIVYRVKRGEYIASAAKRYGDVPLWLIEEFNQMDFRGLQPGDEILIPVVGELPEGVKQPPAPKVIDEEGRPLSETQQASVEPRLRGELFAKARMAIDDSNVFMRPRPLSADAPAVQVDVAGGVVPSVANPAGAVAAAGYPRPENALPSASVGGGLYPNYAGSPPAYGAAGNSYAAANNNFAAAPSAPVAYPSAVVVQGPSAAEPAAAVPGAKPTDATPRDVVVRRGESLMHYVAWSKAPLDVIKNANKFLDPQRILVGARISIPMSDEQYLQFVKSRVEWDKQRAEAAAAEDGKGPKKADKDKKVVKTHTVKSGETATSIARSHRVSVKDLKTANPGVNLKALKVGSKVVLPAKAK